MGLLPYRKWRIGYISAEGKVMLLSLVSLSTARPRILGGTVQDTADGLIKTQGGVIRNNPWMRILK